MTECPWCWEYVREEDAVMSHVNGLLYHDDCIDLFNEVISQDEPVKSEAASE